MRLHVDKTTHLEGILKVRDKVDAYVTDKGHARVMYHITQLQLVPQVMRCDAVLSLWLVLVSAIYAILDVSGIVRAPSALRARLKSLVVERRQV